MTVVQIEWLDHYSVYGWFPPEATEAAGHVNISTGFLVGEQNGYTTIAQTVHQDRGQYADLLHIITDQIISLKEFK